MRYTHWADRNAALYKVGSSPTQIANELGVNHNSVSQTIRGQITSYRIASRLSAVTGVPLNQLFPDGRYTSSKRRAA